MEFLTWLILSTDLPFWVGISVCIVIAFLIAFLVYGLFALLDMFRINKKDDYE